MATAGHNVWLWGPNAEDRYSRLPPELTSLNPTSGVVGTPVTLHALGDHLKGGVISYDGAEVPTTEVSDTELTTDINPTTAGVYPVTVIKNGVETAPLDFTIA